MRCPTCTDSTLVMSDRQGVEIDYCPQCRGVWLDRGELDKLVERSLGMTDDRRAHRPRHHDGHPAHGRRPKSWLSEIFD
jgi:hypothetical protein